MRGTDFLYSLESLTVDIYYTVVRMMITICNSFKKRINKTEIMTIQRFKSNKINKAKEI